MRSSARRASIDWARGLAVLLMIEAHTTDAWTRAADRATTTYGDLRILGGFAAPLFLWLAGLGVAFSASRTAGRTGSRADAVRAIGARGLEIFILAFLFRLQAFLVSPGSHPVTLFRVDVLNVMGPAMIGAVLAWASARDARGRVIVCASVAAFIALMTPIVRASTAIDALPIWLQWYMRPAGEHTTFTLFPWAGFVFAGAAAGAAICPRASCAAIRSGDPVGRDDSNGHRPYVWLGVAGIAIVAASFYAASQPTIYRVPSFFWTSSPAWFGIRVGLMMVALSALDALQSASERTDSGRASSPVRAVVSSWQAPLASLGRASLFVYWIHVELVYGYASWLWHHRLPIWMWAVAYVAFAAAMYHAIGLRDALVEAWRQRSVIGAAQAPRKTALFLSRGRRGAA